MSMSDPVADLLTRIRNAQAAAKADVSMPSSTLKVAIAKILKEEGYITSYSATTDVKSVLTIVLKYHAGKPLISKIRRVSRPGLRAYASRHDVPKILGGLGIAVISTSKGVMSDRRARRLGEGGEVLCFVE
jgi:small subunit ribosomal protein S8